MQLACNGSSEIILNSHSDNIMSQDQLIVTKNTNEFSKVRQYTDTDTSGPILSYLNDTGTSGPILSYINPYSLPSTKCRDMTIGCSMCPWLSLALVVHLTSLFLIQRSYFNNQQYPAGSWLCSLLRVTGTWFV